VAADRKMIGRIFHVMKWTSAELERTIAALLDDGAVLEVEVNGLDHPRLISNRALQRPA
jgi:hypothetical protein